jgi:hypothetical protein
MPPARGLTPDNNRRANEGANVDANADADAPPLFQRASQNLTAMAMLLCGCSEAGTSEERRVRQQLKVLLEARTGGGREHHPPTARILLLPSIQSAGREAEPRHRRSRVVLGPTATRGTPSRPNGGPRVSTTTATTARATTTTVDAYGATTAMATATVAGQRISKVHRPLARASAMRSFLRASALQPMY